MCHFCKFATSFLVLALLMAVCQNILNKSKTWFRVIKSDWNVVLSAWYLIKKTGRFHGASGFPVARIEVTWRVTWSYRKLWCVCLVITHCTAERILIMTIPDTLLIWFHRLADVCRDDFFSDYSCVIFKASPWRLQITAAFKTAPQVCLSANPLCPFLRIHP